MEVIPAQHRTSNIGFTRRGDARQTPSLLLGSLDHWGGGEVFAQATHVVPQVLLGLASFSKRTMEVMRSLGSDKTQEPHPSGWRELTANELRRGF